MVMSLKIHCAQMTLLERDTYAETAAIAFPNIGKELALPMAVLTRSCDESVRAYRSFRNNGG